MTKKIPFVDLAISNKKYKNKYLKIINQIINESNFIKGKNNMKFEEEISKTFKCKYSLAVNSGTDALIIAIKCLNFKKKDEVIMTSNTWISAAYAIAIGDAKPVFADINTNNFQMDIESFKKKINKNTKACVITHLYGFPNEMDKIKSICKKNKILIIEDLAQSHLATYKNKLVGTFGNVAILSFYPSKNLGALGDGGAIITNDKKLFKKCKIYANYGSLNFKNKNHDTIGISTGKDTKIF